IKFFLQKDVPDAENLHEQVRALGGSVEEKIPRAGYVLIVPGSAEGERLRMCWDKNQERPERYFVPYTFVEACKTAGTLIRQLFIENGQPLRFHLDPSIANPNTRLALSQRIAHSGGDPTANSETARVILGDQYSDSFQRLVHRYQSVQDKYVESFQWVKKCIDKGTVTFTPVVYKNPGGRRPGEERQQFSEQDEMHLCQWIAEKIPYKETGGRTGNRLYIQLVERASDPSYAWVSRHTWQSWRERYKKNATRLDAIIANIVEERKPALGEKGQYGYVRKPEEKASSRSRNRRKKLSTTETHFAPHGMPHPGAMPPMLAHPPPHMYPQLGPPMMPPPHPDDLVRLGNGPLEHPHIPGPGLARVQRTESVESDPEWAIREGNHTQPNWAKRRYDGEEDGRQTKRARTDSALHVVDQSIQDIAREFRFTVEEVQQYYDKCGAMERTRARFNKMRQMLDALPDLD
ncbi:hypothetical protein K488DRAFT_56018, partial [Vararia minispora EC-137]